MALIPQLTFPLIVPNISKLDSIDSPEIIVCGIPWTISVYKQMWKTEPILRIQLKKNCQKNVSSNWSHAAFVKFKLKSFNDTSNDVEGYTWPRVFNAGTGSTVTFISTWAELFDVTKNYVKDDIINLEITIIPDNHIEKDKSNLNFKVVEKSCENACFAIFHLTVTNINNLLAVQSPPFMLDGSPWNLRVFKCPSKYLGVSLSSFQNKPCKKRMRVKLIPVKDCAKPVENTKTFDFDETGAICGMNEFILWDELLKPANGFIQNNSITLEVEISIDWANMDQAKSVPIESQPSDIKCPICLDYIKQQEISSVQCGHLFCSKCIKESIEKFSVCPICKAPATLDDLRRTYLPFSE